MTKIRLDQALVERGLISSRARARDAILRGTVRVDGTVATKAGLLVGAGAALIVEDPASRYVSRAALKLVAGLDHFQVDVKDVLALDIGASTGGFTQVLLERGARHVISIDVGTGQMDPRIAGDQRVTNLENINARALTRDAIGGVEPDFLVSDVSFISLRLALPPSLQLAAPGAYGIFLVKPQFEAGKEAIGKGGLLRDPADGTRIAEEMHEWLDAQAGWRALGTAPSPITGGDGNYEFLLAGMKDK